MTGLGLYCPSRQRGKYAEKQQGQGGFIGEKVYICIYNQQNADL